MREGHEVRKERKTVLQDLAADAVPEERHVEVDEKTQVQVGEAKVGEELRFMRVRAMTTPPPTGRQPPARLVPAPRGRKGTLCWLQSLTISATCSALVGKTTTSGVCFEMVKPSQS